jgi:hypothetical protein
MRRSALRISILAIGTALVFGLGAATASACNEPTLSLGKTQASGGETVPFTIGGTEEGANYTLAIRGQTVASGADTTPESGLSGSFSMPAHGGTQTVVYVDMTADHAADGGRWTHTRSITYVPPSGGSADMAPPPAQSPAPPSAESPASPPSAEAPASPPSAQAPASPPSAQPPASPPSAETGRGSNAGAGSPGGTAAVPEHVAKAITAGASVPSHAASGMLSSPVPTRAAAASASAAAADAARDSAGVAVEGAGGTGPEGQGARFADVLGGDTNVGPVAVPTISLVALALALALGLGGIGLLIVVSRGLSPDRQTVATELAAGLDEVEAELQEMIAEERARQVLSAPPDPPPRSSSAESRTSSTA